MKPSKLVLSLSLALLTSGSVMAQLEKRYTGEKFAVSLVEFATAADCVKWAPAALEKARSLKGEERVKALISVSASVKRVQLWKGRDARWGSVTPEGEITLGMSGVEAALLGRAPSLALKNLSSLEESAYQAAPAGLALYYERVAETSELLGGLPQDVLPLYNRVLKAKPEPGLRALALVRSAHLAQALDNDPQVATYLEEAMRLLPADSVLGAHARAALARSYVKKDPERARFFLARAREALTGRLKTPEEAGIPETHVALPTEAQVQEHVAETAKMLGS